MRKQIFMDLSVFICPECENQFPIFRSHGKHRERGHIKDLWCPFCKADRKFLEVRRGDCYVDGNGNVVYV